MDNRPIGFLDSGVGGLTVVRELMRQLPHEEIVYIGDSARAPYGPRPAEQIREYTWQLVNFLLTKDCLLYTSYSQNVTTNAYLFWIPLTTLVLVSLSLFVVGQNLADASDPRRCV